MSEFEWIPVGRTLPPINQKVLLLNWDTYSPSSHLHRHWAFRIVVGYFTPQQGWCIEGCAEIGVAINVHYWMAYPEIPIIKEENS